MDDKASILSPSPTSHSPLGTLAGLPVELKRVVVAHLAPRWHKISMLREALEEDLAESYAYGTNIDWQDQREEAYEKAQKDVKSLSLVNRSFQEVCEEVVWQDLTFNYVGLQPLLDVYLTLLPSKRGLIKRVSATRRSSWKGRVCERELPAVAEATISGIREVSGTSSLLRQVEGASASQRLERGRQILVNRILQQFDNLRELIYDQQSWQQLDPATDHSFHLFEPVVQFLHPFACESLARLDLSAAYDGARSAIDRLLQRLPNLVSLDLSLSVFPDDGSCDLVPLYATLPSLSRLQHWPPLITSALFRLFFTCPLSSLKLNDELATVFYPVLLSSLTTPTFRLTTLFLFFSPIEERAANAFLPPTFPPAWVDLPFLKHLVFGSRRHFRCLPFFTPSPLISFAVLSTSGMRGRDIRDFLEARSETLKEVFIAKRAGDDYGWGSDDEGWLEQDEEKRDGLRQEEIRE